MRKYISVLIFLLFSFLTIQGQNYFQQRVAYTITVKLNDEEHSLSGRIRIEYTNLSRNSLDSIFMHLWPNAYKNNKTAFAKQQIQNGKVDFYFAKPEERGYIDSLHFHINGKPAKWYLTENIDIAVIKLNKPLKPKETIIIETPFYVKLPKTFSRLGHVGQTYQITQWYPKPAVYDKYGWHPYPYLDQGEFYSEFAHYTVTIKVPQDYVVLATGNLVTKEEIKWLEEREKLSRKFLALPSDSVKFPTSKNKKYKTLVFKQADVHDFAWFAAKNYYYLSDTLRLPSGRIIKVQVAFFERNKKLWEKAIDYTKYAVKFYSEKVGEYPYDVVTVVQGPLGAGAGMEYPTITILDGSTPKALKTVIVHEVGHNWFYGILATDERRFPWMDEGTNSFYENKAMNAPFFSNKLALAIIQGENLDQPIQEPADKYTNINYGVIIYMKTPLLLKYLENYMGEKTFQNAMKLYYKTWKFKHPYPEDMKIIFQHVAKEKLDWFFDSLFNSSSIPDFALKYKKGKLYAYNISKYKLDKSVKSYIYFYDKDNNVIGKKVLSELSYNNPVEIDSIPENTYRITINPEQLIMEENIHNNDIFIRKLFKSWANPKIILGFKEEKTYERHINLFPAFGFNYTNKLMIGSLISYQFFPKHNFQFFGIPLYSIADQNIYFISGAIYRMWFEKVFRKVQIKNISGQYANLSYNRFLVEGYIKNKIARKREEHKLLLKINNTRYVVDSLNKAEEVPEKITFPAFGSFSWQYECWNVLTPVSFNISLGTDFKDATRIELSGSIKRRIIKPIYTYIQSYLGINNGKVPNYMRLTFSGYDAFGDYILFDRYRESEKLISRQLVLNQGNFRAYIPKSSKSFLSTVNTGILLWKVFDFRYDLGFYKNDIDSKIYSEYAVSVGINIANLVGIYFPVYSSLYSNNFPKNFKEFSKNITFFVVYDIDKMIKKLSF